MLQMNKSKKTLQIAISVSYTLVGSILLFGGIGYYLSKKFHNPFLFFGGLILGAIIGLYELYKQINK